MPAQALKIEHPHPYIETRPGVQGGRPVIRGTRFPVSSIVANYRRGLTVEEILQEFPHLSPAQIHDALSYYDNSEEIERELAECDDLEARQSKYPGSTVGLG